MKTLVFDAVGGVAGDMIVAALLSAGDSGEQEAWLRQELSKLVLPHWEMQVKVEKKGALAATSARFLLTPEHTHRHLAEIETIIRQAVLPTAATALALRAFQILAEAEGRVHGCSAQEVHFHEVGGLDTILDIVAAALLYTHLGIERCVCGPLPLGHGEIACAHGLIPLPGPAVSAMLQGVSVRDAGFAGETVTPTGLALLKAFNCEFGSWPELGIQCVGVGCGDADFPVPNLLRAYIGEDSSITDDVWLLATNVDDMTGEQCGYLMERAFQAGALDVWFNPIQMKKNRPGLRICLLAEAERRDALRDLLFAESSTLGITYRRENRWTLERKTEIVGTQYGEARVKIARGYGAEKVSAEYEDAAKLARQSNKSLAHIQTEILEQRRK